MNYFTQNVTYIVYLSFKFNKIKKTLEKFKQNLHLTTLINIYL